MNGIKLLELAVALAPLVQSATADQHACREWRLCREAWLAALEELNLSEDTVRDLASRRLSLTRTDVMQ